MSGLKWVDSRLHSRIPSLLPSPIALESILVKIMEIYQDPLPSSSMDSDFNWPDYMSPFGLTLTSTLDEIINFVLLGDRSPPHHKAHRFPVEIFSEIFLYTVQADPRSQTNLMLVCRNWHGIMLSTPGIHSQLRIYKWTEKKDVERFGRRWLLDVTVDIKDKPTYGWRYRKQFNPVEFYACFTAAAEAASRWRSLVLVSFPPPGEYEDLKITHPLLHLESFKLAASCDLGNFLEPLITAITTTVTPRFTVMEVSHSDAALLLVQPAHFQTFSSLTNLRLICRRMQNPVDILPSLHKLEIFEAHHLSLPIYPLAVDLPLTKVLRVLHLKSVSVQWVTGQSFPALKECSIIFPHHADAIQSSVYMPSCSNLKYDSNNLGALEHFHIPHLNKLEIKCGQWRTWRGTLQFVAVHPIFAAQSLTCLRLEIKCSERLLAYMLRLVPALEELWMGLSSPRALGSAFFLAFAGGGRYAGVGPPGQTVSPLCRKLRKLHLHYKRWSRGAERNGLIPAFGAIVASHLNEEQMFSCRLGFSEGPYSQEWIIHEPVESMDIALESDRTFIGISSPHGIVLLSRNRVGGEEDDYHDDVHDDLLTKLGPFRELEYISTDIHLSHFIDDFFSFHSLKEVRIYNGEMAIRPNAQLLPNVPLFHTLMVLHVPNAPSSFLAGHTFHKLERYQEERNLCKGYSVPDPLTEMPVCTRLVVPLTRLATLKLPQIRELGVFPNIEHKEPNYIWEQHIAVNANLSGLKLLHLFSHHDMGSIFDVIKILGFLPDLQTLVIHRRYLDHPYVDFFEAFIPMNARGISASNEVSGVLCPRLESLQIEGIRLTNQKPELMSVLKDIVSLRAMNGFPFKSFTFYRSPDEKWELIGRDRSFMMEEVVPAEPFRLDI